MHAILFIIFLGLGPFMTNFDAKYAFISLANIKLWVTQKLDLTIYIQKMHNYYNNKTQTHNQAYQFLLQKKE